MIIVKLKYYILLNGIFEIPKDNTQIFVNQQNKNRNAALHFCC